jgi:hypothetical protein
MRNLCQTDRLANVGPVFDHGDDPAMIELQERTQNHQREELMLGVVLAAEPAGVGGKSARSDLDGLPGQRHRRPRHRSGGFHAQCMQLSAT